MTDEPLSPELALVSPELAEAARAALPERPWEAFLPGPAPPPPPAPPAPPASPPPAPAPAAEEQLRRPPVPDAAPAAPREAPAPPPVAPRRRRRVPITPFILAGLAVVVTVAGYLPASDAPVLISTPPNRPAPPNGRPVPGTYVDGQAVRLQVAADGTLTGTVVSVACAAAGPVSGRIGRDGSFRGTVSTRAAGRRITGSLLGRRTGAQLQGVVRLESGKCDSGPVLFSAKRVAAPDE
jgi:hypothetical protein